MTYKDPQNRQSPWFTKQEAVEHLLRHYAPAKGFDLQQFGRWMVAGFIDQN